MRPVLAVIALFMVTACAGGSAPESEQTPSAAPAVTQTATSATPSSSATATPTPDAAEQRRLDEALIAAAWDDDVRRARQLIRQGADVNWRDDTVQNAFLIASSEGYLQLLELTLESGARVGLHDSFDGTAIIRAAERGHWDIVGRLLQTRLVRQVDHVNNLGWTALHEAIVLGDPTSDYATTVRVLVAGGVDLTIRATRDGLTALEHARAMGRENEVRTLERAQGDAPADPDASLLAAAESGDADAAAIAIRAGADLDARDAADRTPLLLAVTFDHLEVARLLVALGASPDALDDRHDTPWLVTGVTGSVPMANLLLRYDPDLTILNRFGGTSIIPASERGHVAYVRRVARTGIDINHVNDLGWTALLEAVVLGDGSEPYQRIVRILLRHGADASIPDGDGVTALEHARTSEQDRVARILADAD